MDIPNWGALLAVRRPDCGRLWISGVIAQAYVGQHLAKLDLSDNPLTSEVAAALADLIGSQPELRVLNLNDTSLGDEGVSTISHALATSAPNLEELELALNEVTAASAEVKRQTHHLKLVLAKKGNSAVFFR